MNIFVICQYFPPEPGAPQARISEMADSWVKAGHRVTVLTGMPNHPTGVVPESYRGKIFLKERFGLARVWRHWLYTAPNQGFVKKTLSHLSFMISVALLSLFRGPRPDVVMISSPTFFVVATAWLMSVVRRAVFVFEIRDLWPGIFVELGVLKNRHLIKMLEAVELFFYRKADAVVPVTWGFADNIVNRGIPDEKVHVIPNGVDLGKFSALPANRSIVEKLALPDGKFFVSYVGAHGISHGLETIVRVADILRDQTDIHFLFVGDGAEKKKIETLAAGLGLTNVTFRSSVSKDLVPAVYCISSVCLVPLKDIEGFKSFIPSKMFEIMGTGRPIVASLRGEAARILDESGGALVVEPENPGQIAKAILKIRDIEGLSLKMGSSGRRFVESRFDRSALALKYLEIMNNCVIKYKTGSVKAGS